MGAKIGLRLVAALGLATGVAVGSPGCIIEEQAYLTINDVRAISIEEGTCRAADQGSIPPGIFDVAASACTNDTYLLGLVVANNLPPNDDEGLEDRTSGKIDTNWVQVEEVLIEYGNDVDNWAFLPDETTYRIALSLPSAGGEGSTTAFPVNVISSALSKIILGNGTSPVNDRGESFPLLVTLRVKGRLRDGTVVESNSVSLPVSICNGCLLASPIDCINRDPTLGPPSLIELGIAGCTPPSPNYVVQSGEVQRCSFAQPDGYTCTFSAEEPDGPDLPI